VHLALTANTPLLRHKLERGYPHVVLLFRTKGFNNLKLAALPNNTKAWRSKWQCQPVTNKEDIARLMRSHDEHRRYPSLEILVENFLPLSHLESVLAITDDEASLISDFCKLLPSRPEFPVRLAPNLRPPGYTAKNLDVISDYFASFKWGQNAPTPPSLTFD